MDLNTVTAISIDGRAVQSLALDGKVIWSGVASASAEECNDGDGSDGDGNETEDGR